MCNEAVHRVLVTALLFWKERVATCGIHDHVEALNAICGGHLLRAHDKIAHEFRDGSFIPYSGLVSENLLHHTSMDLLAVEATKLEEMPACNKSTQIFNRMCSKTAPTTSSTFQILSNACSHHSPAQAARDTSNIRLNFSKRRGVPDDKLGKPIP